MSPLSARAVFALALSIAQGVLVAPLAAAPALEKPAANRTPAPVMGAAGSLDALDSEGRPIGACPLQHTDVRAGVSGLFAEVEVVQVFSNPFDEPIEAVYTFPLPEHAAVFDMVLKAGERTIRGEVHPKAAAREIYEAARRQGQLASLLDEERPNIFTQSVANLQPGERIEVALRYAEALAYEDGVYRFVFPMVVGPRYIPGAPLGNQGGGPAPNTNAVPDASRITPPVTPPGTRAGHDIAVSLDIDAGQPLSNVRAVLHDVDIERRPTGARVALKPADDIPNRDFIVEYATATDAIGDALLTHADERGGWFTLVLQPPLDPAPEDATPKEVVFVLDTSGSMSGDPLTKAKETMALCLDQLNPRDTFNLITFAGHTEVLFEQPVPATRENLDRAQRLLDGHGAGGGTEMMKAIRAALEASEAQDHVRIVCFMTDGYVGNDMAVLSEVQKHANARVFSFGVGNSVNRYLLDGMARLGRGEAQYVTLETPAGEAAETFATRIRHPLLTDIALDWDGVEVSEVYPALIPDLFAARPVVVHGRYAAAADQRGTVTLRGNAGGSPFARTLDVDLPARREANGVLAQTWARAKVEDLMNQDLAGMQTGEPRAEVKDAITALGVDYRLLTPFTSFVAVEERTITDGGEPRTITVPVEMPAGVSYEGVFGAEEVTQMANGAVMGRGGAVKGLGGPGRPTTMPRPRVDAVDEPTVEPEAVDKLDPRLRKAIEAAAAPGAEASFTLDGVAVEDGRVEVWIHLVELTDAALEMLREAGAVVLTDSPGARLVVARVALADLDKLAQPSLVRRIEPAR